MTRMLGHGTLLKMSNMAATPVFTTIAQVVSIRGPGLSRGTVEAVDHDLTAGKVYLAEALYDVGEVTLSIHYDPAGGTHDATTGLKSVLISGVETDFQLIYPNTGAAQDDFSAFVTKFEPTGMDANSGKLMADVTLKGTGDIAETP